MTPADVRAELAALDADMTNAEWIETYGGHERISA